MYKLKKPHVFLCGLWLGLYLRGFVYLNQYYIAIIEVEL